MKLLIKVCYIYYTKGGGGKGHIEKYKILTSNPDLFIPPVEAIFKR